MKIHPLVKQALEAVQGNLTDLSFAVDAPYSTVRRWKLGGIPSRVWQKQLVIFLKQQGVLK